MSAVPADEVGLVAGEVGGIGDGGRGSSAGAGRAVAADHSDRPIELELVRPPADLEQVFVQSHRRLVGFARTVMAGADGAEEVVQEAFARTLARWDDVQDKADPLPYLRSVILNLCRGRLRRKPTPLRRLEPVPSAESIAARTARRDAVVAALATLPARQREVVALRYFGELSTEETAAALGISPGTVKTHLHRAVQALAPRLEEHRDG